MKRIIYTFVFSLVFIMTSCVQEEHQKTVTVYLDMSEVENVGNVGVRGNFTDKAWRETISLTDEDGDGIYTTTLSQKTAVYGIEFKFVNQGSDYELKDQPNRELLFEYKPEIIEYHAKFNNNKDIKINRK